MNKIIDAEWLLNINKENLTSLLLEFRYYFKRFSPSLALIIGNAEDEYVRQLIMPNLIEECGELNGSDSHLRQLDNLLISCGIVHYENHKPMDSTYINEKWFFELYKGSNTYSSLCALGPATEAISGNFLFIMKEAVLKTFNDLSPNVTYFDSHLSEMEDLHVENIMKAYFWSKGMAHFKSF